MKIKCFCRCFEYTITIEILKLVFKTIFMNLHNAHSYNSEGTYNEYYSQTFLLLLLLFKRNLRTTKVSDWSRSQGKLV